jgi:hypothetical protein
MATKKISELTLLDTVSANLQQTIIPVLDTTSGTTKKVTLQQINDSVEANIPFAAAAFTQANNANTIALTSGSYANAAFSKANNSLNVSTGGTITGDLTINGNISISGCTATLLASSLRIADHIIDVGFGTSGVASQNAGVRVLRGDENPVQLRWNESSNKWQFTNDGTEYVDFSDVTSSQLSSAYNQANTANTTADASYAKANSANVLAQAAFDSANSRNYGDTNVALYLPTYTGNIAANIVKGGYTWEFGANGTTSFPNSSILAPVGQSITMQSDQYSQLMWENANVTVAPNMAINSNFYVTQNNATLDIGYRDGSGTQVIKSWYWNADGIMTLPAGGVISEGGGISGAIKLKPAGGANDNQALLIYPTANPDGDHVHLTAGGGSTELYLGNDNHYVKLVNGGNVEVRTATANLANSASWTFNVAGDIDANQILRIKVPNGIPSNVTKITDNQGWGEGSVGVNLPTTGGTGTGLTVDVIDGGSGYAIISINTPGTGYLNGDVITVTNGGMSDSFTISIAGRNSWTFGSNGNLTFPDATVQATAWTGIPGPYADDEAAALAGVALGSPYHKTGTGGQVFVRLTSPT